LIVELAIATNISVAAWRAEDDSTIVTALNVLKEQAEEMRARYGR
jgi:hypothetical protein